ncbi:MAG: hypothetical protein AAGA85_17945 [Bacteroidota bacterium]
MTTVFENRCLECDSPLIGREDKKFCDAQCKSNFHNRQNRREQATIRSTNQILKRNREILRNLLPLEGKIVLTKKDLTDRGYDFRHFTSQFQTKRALYYFAYEYGFAPIQGEDGQPRVLLVKYQPYMEKPFDPWQ